jgi:hypothetical protein
MPCQNNVNEIIIQVCLTRMLELACHKYGWQALDTILKFGCHEVSEIMGHFTGRTEIDFLNTACHNYCWQALNISTIPVLKLG